MPVIVFFFAMNAFAQDNYIFYSGGYGISKENLDGLNFVIDKYNSERTHLTKDLDNVNTLHGFTVSGGAIFSQLFIVEFGFTQRTAYSYSDETLQGDQPWKRELLVRSNTIGLGVGYYLFWREGFKLLAGTSADFGKVVLRTRLYNTNDASKPSYVDVGQEFEQDFPNNNSLTAITPFMQFSYSPWGKQFEIMVKPYYQFQLNESDFSYVNQAWNPNTYQQSSPESTKNFANNFGVQLKINVLMGLNL